MEEQHDWGCETFKKISSSEIEKAIAKAVGELVNIECTCKIEKITYDNNILGGMNLTIEIGQQRKLSSWNK